MSTPSDSEDGEEQDLEANGPQTLEDLLMPREPEDLTGEHPEQIRNEEIQQSALHEPNTSFLSTCSSYGARRYVL